MKNSPSWTDLIGSNPIGTAASPDRVSLISLIIANVLPITLAIAFGWDAGGVVMLYWWENLIVGFYAILRIALAEKNLISPTKGSQNTKLFLIPFFCFHYYFFCFVHGVFVMALLSMSSSGVGDVPLNSHVGREWPGPFFIIPVMGNTFVHAWNAMPTAALLSVFLLLASHGISFARNYIGRGEFRETSPPVEMFRPYGRVVLLHVCIIFGGMITMLFGSPLGLVALFMVGKTAIDATIHARSHLGIASKFMNLQPAPDATRKVQQDKSDP